MKKENKHLTQDQILNYLNNRLDASQEWEIERHLGNCPLCTEAVEGYAACHEKNINPTSNSLEERWAIIMAQDKEKINNQSEKIMMMSNSQKNKNSFRWLAAAAVVLVGVIAWWTLQNNSENIQQLAVETEKDLFAANFKPFTNDVNLVLRGENSTTKVAVNLQEAFDFYDKEKYAESLASFEAILAKKPDNIQAAFFAGNAALQTNKIKEAHKHFEMVHLGETSNYSEDAIWYLALTCIKEKNDARAKDFLSELAETDGFYKEKAINLLKEMAK